MGLSWGKNLVRWGCLRGEKFAQSDCLGECGGGGYAGSTIETSIKVNPNPKYKPKISVYNVIEQIIFSIITSPRWGTGCLGNLTGYLLT